MNNKFWNAPAWSMANRHQSKTQSKSVTGFGPGVGSYNLDSSLKKGGYLIGSATRDQNANTNNKVPGPGNYEVNYRNHGPQISMAKKYDTNNQQSRQNNPGPGNYNTSSTLRPNSGITIGAKYASDKGNSEQPGPGSYNLNENGNKKGGVKIGSEKKNGMGKKDGVPGPGEYGYEKRPFSAGPKYGFGKAVKGSGNIASEPGPGHYQYVPGIKGGDQHGFKMGIKNQKIGDSVDVRPGPGYYDIDFKKIGGPGSKIGKAKRGNLNSAYTPGPGAYSNEYRSSHGAKIGTGKRDYEKGSETPGPGSYESAKLLKGGITISGFKGKSRIQNVPGPGAYNPDDFNKARPCSANLSKALRSDNGRLDTPGPGQYHIKQGYNPKFAYTKELRSKEMEKGEPGPGQYEIAPTVPSAPHYLIDPNLYKSYGSGSRA